MKLSLMTLAFFLSLPLFAADRTVQCDVEKNQYISKDFVLTISITGNEARISTELDQPGDEQPVCRVEKSAGTLKDIEDAVKSGEISQEEADYYKKLIGSTTITCDGRSSDETIQYIIDSELEMIANVLGPMGKMSCKDVESPVQPVVPTEPKGEIIGQLMMTCTTLLEGNETELKRTVYMGKRTLYVSDPMGYLAKAEMDQRGNNVVLTYPGMLGGVNQMIIEMKDQDPMGTLVQGDQRVQIACMLNSAAM